ncbi:hypothetical protein [Dyadobacter sp. 676]|uniref:1,4-alpha-glucan branching enzyme n=1 Tax=Dyadobacter sp. 676 TaxID=3088362 RepID=A0AAU8FKY2_9BACT
MATTKSNTKEAPSKTKSTGASEKSASNKSTATKAATKSTTKPAAPKATGSRKTAAETTAAARAAGKKASTGSRSTETKSAGVKSDDKKSSKSTTAKSGGSKATAGKSGGAKKPTGNGQSNTSTRDHDTIRAWVEQRGGVPSIVKGTGKKKDGDGILRIDFPGYSGEDSLEEISWDEFFRKFDESKLEFLYQEKTADGKESRFNKFVSSN